MGVICAVMFSVLDSCARKYPIAFSASALMMCDDLLDKRLSIHDISEWWVYGIYAFFVFMPRYLLDTAPR